MKKSWLEIKIQNLERLLFSMAGEEGLSRDQIEFQIRRILEEIFAPPRNAA